MEVEGGVGGRGGSWRSRGELEVEGGVGGRGGSWRSRGKLEEEEEDEQVIWRTRWSSRRKRRSNRSF